MAIESSLSDSASANFVSAMSTLIHDTDLATAMSTLINDTDLADVTVSCGDKTWKLHANIIASRSPFFRAAFTSNMKEKRELSIDIKDLNPDTMEEVVNYMYGKPIGNAPINFLFEAAERFQMTDLKKDVTTLAKERMTEDNVVEFAKLAEIYNYNTGDFLEECAKFIVKTDMYLKKDLSLKLTKIVLSNLNENFKKAKEELEEAKEELEVTKEELEDTKAELEETKEELKETKRELRDQLWETECELEWTKQDLEDAKEELEETKHELQDQLRESEYELEETKQELEETKKELEESKQEL